MNDKRNITNQENIKKLFLYPSSLGANRLCIQTAIPSPGMVSWLLKTLKEHRIFNISVELVIGTVFQTGISQDIHEAYLELCRFNKKKNSTNNHFVCSYISEAPDINDTIYIWLKDNDPLLAYSGIEFIQSNFLQGKNHIIKETNPYLEYAHYCKSIDRTIYCTYSEIEEYILISNSKFRNRTQFDCIDSENVVNLSLLTNQGMETGKCSGLNWGQRNNRNKNEAYIPLPSKIAKSGFFPLNKQHFITVTDDRRTLLLRVEQQNDKAITTPASNAQLGEYFRNRLGLANGSYISKSDLVNYGRTDVTFYKIDDEQFFMDFSVEE